MAKAEILKILLAEVAQANESHKIAHAEFRAIMNDIPSHLPSPDGVQRLENASTACAHASARERAARARLHLFQAYGLIPKDLK